MKKIFMIFVLLVVDLLQEPIIIDSKKIYIGEIGAISNIFCIAKKIIFSSAYGDIYVLENDTFKILNTGILGEADFIFFKDQIYCLDGGKVEIWNTSGQFLQTLKTHNVAKIMVYKDKILTVSRNEGILIWDGLKSDKFCDTLGFYCGLVTGGKLFINIGYTYVGNPKEIGKHSNKITYNHGNRVISYDEKGEITLRVEDSKCEFTLSSKCQYVVGLKSGQIISASNNEITIWE